MRNLIMATVLVLSVLYDAPVQAQTAGIPCSGPVWWAKSEATFADFDFWEGKWMVFDRASGLMVGFDTIEKGLQGCVLIQHWQHLNDIYTTPGTAFRMEGRSHTALGADGKWHQVWVANNGSYLPLSGGLQEDGSMVLETDWIEFNDRQGTLRRSKHRWHWQPMANGNIHNWGFNKQGDGEWTQYFDIEYRRNVPGGPTANLNEPQ